MVDAPKKTDEDKVPVAVQVVAIVGAGGRSVIVQVVPVDLVLVGGRVLVAALASRVMIRVAGLETVEVEGFDQMVVLAGRVLADRVVIVALPEELMAADFDLELAGRAGGAAEDSAVGLVVVAATAEMMHAMMVACPAV
jgi:hypothetical protein